MRCKLSKLIWHGQGPGLESTAPQENKAKQRDTREEPMGTQRKGEEVQESGKRWVSVL
jgi:hypothetical protein